MSYLIVIPYAVVLFPIYPQPHPANHHVAPTFSLEHLPTIYRLDVLFG
ncbi:hypothetical protein KFU94_04020 [Chloroflexi bacterium TSY]|nr:hypothetical protein [Chloroflexi bacterium TSY]